MSEPFIGEIRIFSCTFAPLDWAFCNGQVLNISQNNALYSVLGATFGGDGRTTFGLPNLQGRAPMDFGQGTGLTARGMGQVGGEPTATLTTAQMPSHTHAANASTAAGAADPTNAIWSQCSGRGAKAYATTATTTTPMNTAALSPTGGAAAHNNLMPYLVLNFCIALAGFFPVRP